MASTTPTPGVHPFERKVDAIRPSKADINNLIMDYLITEGYPVAAQKFAVEANIQPECDLETVQERVEIKQAIHKGDLQTAIEKINELNPQLLDTDASLHFSLLRLQLIELIRTATLSPTPAASNPSISTALAFATTHLAPLAPTDPSFLTDLERTMALLIFDPSKISTSPQLAELIDPRLRGVVASRVNEAILQSQGERRSARIRDLVKLRAWSEKIAREQNANANGNGNGGRKIELPERLELGLDNNGAEGRSGENGDANGSAGGGGGGGDTSMTGNGEAEGLMT